MRTVRSIGVRVLHRVRKVAHEVVAESRPEPWLRDAIVRTSLRRLGAVAGAAIPLSLLFVVQFARLDAVGEDQERWRQGIMVSHAVLIMFMAWLLSVTLRSRGRVALTVAMRWIRPLVLVVMLAFGAVVSAIDQLVTPSVTPFLVAATVAGLVVLLPPLPAIVGFLGGFAVFSLALGAVQDDVTILASNRTNGLTAAAIGAVISTIMWHAESRNLRQRDHIERQQELLEATNRELAQLASFDPLTGLANRRAFQLMIDNELEQMRREGHPSTLVLLDADDFKHINDVHGHPAGDELLCQLANLLTERLRGSDTLARWGGEEFLVLLPRTDAQGAAVVAEQLRHEVASRSFDLGSVTVQITVSGGIAEIVAADPEPIVDAYREVDDALYSAKRAGKNRVVVARTLDDEVAETVG